LTRVTLSDVVSCGASLRTISEGSEYLEDVAQSVSEHFFELLRDRHTGERQVVLARFFKCHLYSELPEELRVFALDVIQGAPIPEDFYCLTLLGTAGVEPEWNSRLNSVHHKAVPLIGETHLTKRPMLAELFAGLGWRADGRGLVPTDRTCDIFLVKDAQGHCPIPVRETFVIPYSIKSVISFGGALGAQELFCVVLFTNAEVEKQSAEMFRSLGLCAQLGVIPLQGRVFRGQAPQHRQSSSLLLSPSQVSELLNIYDEDIRRQAAAELFLGGALKVIPDSFFRFGSDGTILNYRDRGALGQITESVQGRRVQDVLSERLALDFDTAIAQASRTKSIVPLVYPLDVNGTERTFEARFIRLPTRGQIIAVVRDITTRLQAEELLLLQGRRAAAIAELRKTPNGESEDALIFRGLGIIETFTGGRSASFLSVEVKGHGHEPLVKAPSAEDETLVSQILETELENGVGRTRNLTVNLKENGSTVAVFELEIDESDYSDTLIESVQGLAQALWQVVKQKRNSAELAKLAQALDQSPLSVVITNTAAEIEYVNSAFIQSTGYQAKEVLGRNPKVLNSGETPIETYRDLWRTIDAGRTWKGEFHNRRKDGSLYPEFAIVAPLRDPGGTITHYVAVKEDITEKKRLGKELDEHRHRLENLVQLRTAALAEKTEALELAARFDRCESHVLASFNERTSLTEMLDSMLVILAEDLGLTTSFVHLRDQLTGELSLFSSFEPRFALPTDLLERIGRKEGPSYFAFGDNQLGFVGQGGLRNDCKGLDVIPLVCQEEILGFLTVAVWWDSEEHQEALLRRLADQVAVAIQAQRQYERMEALTARLNEREQRIARQNAALERASRLKSEFLANMSHELRTPLNAIIGFSEVMIDGLVGDLNEQQADYASEILSAGQYLLSLINDILDLSKIEAGKMKLQYSVIDPRLVCENALSIVRARARENKIELSLDFDPRVGSFLADERMFKQILYNLLSNAVKFTKDGRVSLTSSLSEDSGSVLFVVEDSGIGIAVEDQTNLFKPFQQVDGSASRQFEGTGLGLALCKNLAELHSGYIHLKSELGAGSRFEVALPYIQDVSPDAESSTPRGGRKLEEPTDELTALVIEDEDPAAELLSLHLNKANWRVVRARSLLEGFALLDEVQPSLVLLDLLLPELDGLRMLERIKSDPKTSCIPVIVVSIIGEENRQRAMELGAADVLQKPVSQARLLESLKGVLV
jgi:PAS domain S-box-containing protein